jgi:hypothetical protein
MAERSQLIVKPIRGLGKLMLDVSAKAWTLAVAGAADTKGTVNVAGSRPDRDADDREMPGAGPDDSPTEREERESPIHMGA